MRLDFLTKIYIFGTQRPVVIMLSWASDLHFELEKQDFRHMIIKHSGR